jgi:hypothetical protein
MKYAETERMTVRKEPELMGVISDSGRDNFNFLGCVVSANELPLLLKELNNEDLALEVNNKFGERLEKYAIKMQADNVIPLNQDQFPYMFIMFSSRDKNNQMFYIGQILSELDKYSIVEACDGLALTSWVKHPEKVKFGLWEFGLGAAVCDCVDGDTLRLWCPIEHLCSFAFFE